MGSESPASDPLFGRRCFRVVPRASSTRVVVVEGEQGLVSRRQRHTHSSPWSSVEGKAGAIFVYLETLQSTVVEFGLLYA